MNIRPSRIHLAIGAVLIVGVLLIAPGGIRSASAADDFRYLVRMKDASFIPASGDLAQGLDYLAQHRSEGAVHLLLQLNEVPDADARVRLSDQGLLLQGAIPERAYFALVSTSLTADALRSMGVRWMVPLGPVEKLSPRLRAGEFGSWTEYNGQKIIAVQFHDDVTRSSADQILAGFAGDRGGWIQSLRTQVLACDPGRLSDLAAMDAVKYIEQIPPPMSPVNDGTRSALSVNTLFQAPYGLSGHGSNVLVYDAGMVSQTHPDFATNRVTWGESGAVAAHSTHVGGTVAGNGSASGGTYKGMAPQALITSYKYESCTPNCLYNSPQDIEANYTEGFFTFGANLATNSIGSNIAPNGYPCSWEGDYELTAQLVDAISNGSLGRPFLSVWAAGNERAYGNCGTTYNTIGVPATAKDNIVVGATNSNDHSMTYFSSWGPVDDGRIRPDICAPGCQNGGDGGITSCATNGGYTVMCGTSMATPAVSGVIALLLEQWRQTQGLPIVPAPATVKALLVNTAFDYGNTGPDYQFGYGEIRPVEMIDHLRNGALTREGVVDQGGERIFYVDVPAGQTVLKVTVAWDDVPGQLLAAKELVNDLDLTLEAPAGQITLPWVLNSASPSSPATRAADHTNPLEQVLVNTPAAGVWKIHVAGYQVPQGPQKFSLVANAQLTSSDVAQPIQGPTVGSITNLASVPNPFAPRTTLRFTIDGTHPVSLYIYDSSGRMVRGLMQAERRDAGTHFVTWDGKDDRGVQLPSGVYFYQVVAGQESAGRKVLLVR